MIPFGKRIEPMVDRYLIGSAEDVSFRLEKPAERGKVLGFEKPWEGPGSLGLSVLQDGENVKMYYRGYPHDDGGDGDYSWKQTSCLAVSADGVRFERYPVNRIAYDGITENNIVRMDVACHNFAPFYDTNPACPPDERYKAIGGIGGDSETRGMHVYASPDGIRWRDLTGGPVIDYGEFDSMNMAFWDPAAGLYRCYIRYFDRDVTPDHAPWGVRAIRSAVSKDFIRWTQTVHNEYPEGLTDQLYTNAARPIPGAAHVLLSIPMRFQEARKKFPEYRYPGVSDALLMTSRDGVRWTLPVRDAWLSGGLNGHEWTQRNFISLGGVVEMGDDFLLYAMKNYMWEDGGIWAYSIPRYRFASVYADGDGGRFTTKELAFETDDIHLNFATSAYGGVRVRVLDEGGAVRFVSEELYGNEISCPLHVDGLAGTCGKLEIALREAHLYALGADMGKRA